MPSPRARSVRWGVLIAIAAWLPMCASGQGDANAAPPGAFVSPTSGGAGGTSAVQLGGSLATAGVPAVPDNTGPVFGGPPAR